MQTKVYLGLTLGMFLVGFAVALGYGYTDANTGSQVYFNEQGKIIGVEDEVLQMSRYPTSQEKIENKYLPMSSEKTLGECLTDKGVIFYGAYWCPHCARQKELFGDDISNVNYFECEDEKQTCIDVGIKAYPTWKINGELYSGVRTLEELSELSGCPI